MIDTKEYSEAAVEVLDIIKHFDEDQIDQIPLEFIQILNQKRSSNYVANIDYTKPLEENNLKHETKVILALMYREYFCTEEEKIKFNEDLEKNSYKKYNVNVFDKKVEQTEQELQLVPIEKKKNLFQRIFDSIFKIK